MHLRGIVRAENDGQYSLVGGAVNVVIADPQEAGLRAVP